MDEWIAKKSKRASNVSQGGARPARLIRLKPMGFPFREHRALPPISITDEKLFESYAKDQWIGATVKKGDYLFDQRVIPDFAFEVTKVIPATRVVIADNTTIQIEKKDLDRLFRVEGYKFSDIIGHEGVKQKCKIIMKYLKNPERFGEWAPRNVLFYGPPGTGKTMTAKALANETDASFYLVRATDLIGEYVGDSSKRIHELFAGAVENAPSVIFIDELDAIGLDRSYQSVRGDVSEVVNSLLTELDGLKENRGVVTIAATNNPNMLDYALRGRFEEEFEFKLPAEKERLEILRSYVKKLPKKVPYDLRQYAKATEGFSGRDLKEKLLKVALHRAILSNAKRISRQYIDDALKRAMPSGSKPPKEMFH